MKVYLMTDYEGVAGVHTWEDREDDSQDNFDRRMHGRRWLAREVQAAVDGSYAGGATLVLVNDGHGAGYTIDLDELDERPLVIHGRERPFWLPYLDATCAATGLIGGHAKAGTPQANLAHTMCAGIRNYSFNGLSLGEAGLQAAIAGHYGVPFVFASGDAHLCQEMAALIPGVVTAPVKVGLSRLSTMTRAPQEAQDLIRRRMEEAMGRIGQIAPFKLETPILLREEWEQPVYDEWNPPPHSRVLDSRTREVEGADIIDLVNKLYGYDPAFQPLPYEALTT
jgi:D-amino peptidase